MVYKSFTGEMKMMLQSISVHYIKLWTGCAIIIIIPKEREGDHRQGIGGEQGDPNYFNLSQGTWGASGTVPVFPTPLVPSMVLLLPRIPFETVRMI